jgi:hypothetical protein
MTGSGEAWPPHEREILMRYTLTALMVAGMLATSGLAMAQTTKPASGTASKPAAKPATHSAQGVVKSVDDSSLVITHSGKKGSDMSFKLDSSTQREGTIAVGTPVSIRYHMDGSTMVASAVHAEAPKATKTAKK